MNLKLTKNTEMSALMRRKEKWGYIFLTPWLLIFGIFYLYPLVYGFCVSFTDFSLSGAHFNGLSNYKKIVNDYAFWRSFSGTIRYAIIVIPLQIIFALCVANVLRTRNKRVNTIAKLLIYLPSVTCSVALVVVWNFVFWPNVGILSQILASFGITAFSVFDNANISIPIIALIIVFSNLGQNVVIFCGAVNGVPATYYEAAELDGASEFQQFIKITIPMIFPTIVYTIVTGTIGALQIFVIPMMLTGGGPNYSSSTLLMLIYNSAFTNNQFGYASAIGIILFLLAGIIAVIQFRLTQRDSIQY